MKKIFVSKQSIALTHPIAVRICLAAWDKTDKGWKLETPNKDTQYIYDPEHQKNPNKSETQNNSPVKNNISDKNAPLTQRKIEMSEIMPDAKITMDDGKEYKYSELNNEQKSKLESAVKSGSIIHSGFDYSNKPLKREWITDDTIIDFGDTKKNFSELSNDEKEIVYKQIQSGEAEHIGFDANFKESPDKSKTPEFHGDYKKFYQDNKKLFPADTINDIDAVLNKQVRHKDLINDKVIESLIKQETHKLFPDLDKSKKDTVKLPEVNKLESSPKTEENSSKTPLKHKEVEGINDYKQLTDYVNKNKDIFQHSKKSLNDLAMKAKKTRDITKLKEFVMKELLFNDYKSKQASYKKALQIHDRDERETKIVEKILKDKLYEYYLDHAKPEHNSSPNTENNSIESEVLLASNGTGKGGLKDKDLMKDTGGKSNISKPDLKPSRTDCKKRYKVEDLPKEEKKDFNDVINDKDLKL